MSSQYMRNLTRRVKDGLEETREFRKELNAVYFFYFKVSLCVFALMIAYMYISVRHDAYIAKIADQYEPEQQVSVAAEEEFEEDGSLSDSDEDTDNFAEEYIAELLQGKAFRIAMKLCKNACGSQYYKQGNCYNKLQPLFVLHAGMTLFSYDVDVLDAELADKWEEEVANYRTLSRTGKQSYNSIVFGCNQ